MNKRREERPTRRRGRRLVFGALLMIAGGLLLADRLGLGIPISVWRLWPFLLLGAGLARMVWSQPEEREGGFWMLLAGLYGWVGVFGIAGLTWATAWPIFLVGAGLWMMVGKAISAARRSSTEEAEDVR